MNYKPRSKPPGAAVDYILKNVPEILWLDCQRKAAESGSSMRWVLLELLEAYRGGSVTQDPPVFVEPAKVYGPVKPPRPVTVLKKPAKLKGCPTKPPRRNVGAYRLKYGKKYKGKRPSMEEIF